MKKDFLSTDSYKGVRDFYPEDMAIQQYIFDSWRATAESFGYQRYDASILEPATLYKSKGAENAELVNEQTYTFTDRGEREVTLRPEMTPSVARMVAKKHRELALPLRWYSIPNLFRYERPQRGRLREHWQLNCDLFGSDDFTADIEMIALAYQTLINFGATPDMFSIRVNDRALMARLYKAIGLEGAIVSEITKLNDRRSKIDPETYRHDLVTIVGSETLAEEVIMMLDKSDEETDIVAGLAELGITNVIFDKSLARGFDYYTGTIFEVFDTSDDNNRALLGGGRYDNLTKMFTDESISGIGFGMGDVTMRDFLGTHKLLPKSTTLGKRTVVLPTDAEYNLAAQKIATVLRDKDTVVVVDLSTKKLPKKLAAAHDSGATKIVVVGETEISTNSFTLKDIISDTESTHTF